MEEKTNTQNLKLCMECRTPIIGRKDKKYCDVYCKSAYQYKLKKKHQPSFHNKIMSQLRRNKKILKRFNTTGKAMVNEKDILEAGFNPRIFTHYWRRKRGEYYLFVYSYGFYRCEGSSQTKYLLVRWQDYMDIQLEPPNTVSIQGLTKGETDPDTQT